MRREKGIAILAVIVMAFFCFSSCKKEPSEEAVKISARGIHERVLTVDTHCDTPSRLISGEWDIGVRHDPAERRSGKIDFPRMKEGGMDAVFFAVYLGQGERSPEGYARARERAFQTLDALDRMYEKYPGLAGRATSPEDAYRLEQEGKRAIFIGMENGYQIGKDLSLLKEYYLRGVRYVTLCHSRDNDICDSSTDSQNPGDNGLSDFGREAVAECNRLGIMIDVSHISDKSFFDVLEVTEAPVIASHSSVRSLCDSPRNLSDEMLKALAGNGGVIQVCILSDFLKRQEPNPERDKAIAEIRKKYSTYAGRRDEALREKIWQEMSEVFQKYPSDRATVKDAVDHIDHVVRLIGINHVGIGTDFDGGGGIEGCDEVSQMPQLTEELVRRGYSAREIEKIWGGNVMRVFRKVIETAKTIQARS